MKQADLPPGHRLFVFTIDGLLKAEIPEPGDRMVQYSGRFVPGTYGGYGKWRTPPRARTIRYWRIVDAEIPRKLLHLALVEDLSDAQPDDVWWTFGVKEIDKPIEWPPRPHSTNIG